MEGKVEELFRRHRLTIREVVGRRQSGRRRIRAPILPPIPDTFPVLIVTGPRQVGKTTLLKHIAEQGRGYVTLDDPLLRQLAVDEPALFLERFEVPVIIDEIQYAPELLPYIKMRVDRGRGSMPALYSDEHRPDIEQYYSSNVQTYLQRDIKDLSQVGDEFAFLRFLTAVAVRTGQMLQYADLGRDVGIGAPTAKQ